MSEKVQYVQGHKVTPEELYRRKLRITARILDHDIELKNVGYGEEILEEFRRNPIQSMSLHKKFAHIFDGFQMKLTGYERELIRLFDKYDALMKNCRSNAERQAIATMGVMEVSQLLDNGEVGIGGSITVNGQTILEKKE